jgi:hypothetical protein
VHHAAQERRSWPIADMQEASANVRLGEHKGPILHQREARGRHLSRGSAPSSMVPSLSVTSSLFDLPDRLFDGLHVQPRLQKYLSFHLTQITGLSRVIPYPIEGRFAIVTDVGFGMRWTRLRAGRSAPARGRRSRVVLTPRRWRSSCAEVSARRWWQQSPVIRESTKETVKTTAQGVPGDPVNLW